MNYIPIHALEGSLLLQREINASKQGTGLVVSGDRGTKESAAEEGSLQLSSSSSHLVYMVVLDRDLMTLSLPALEGRKQGARGGSAALRVAARSLPFFPSSFTLLLLGFVGVAG